MSKNVTVTRGSPVKPGFPATVGRGADADCAGIAVVTVTYNPDPKILERQLSQLPSAALKIIVDNASRSELRIETQRVAAAYAAIYLQNSSNTGLPAALNQGARHAGKIRPACRFLLLLDQDTEPGAGCVERLVASYDRIATAFGKACCIGPRLVDVSTGLDHGFHQIRGWRWSRKFPSSDSQIPVPLANINGSGTLIPLKIFNELNGLEDDLFIDLVDAEWSFRVLAAGYGLYGVPDITFRHRMGERGLRFWLLHWRVWPERSPQRNYYLFRNAVWLMRRSYVPGVWKVWAVVKLAITVLVYLAVDSKRDEHMRYMWKGLREGLAGTAKDCNRST